LVWV
jgi:hypothetical protein